MKQTLDENSIAALVLYRINRAKETMVEAQVIAENGYYNTAMNRIYYACFYAVLALLIKNNIAAQTHSGARQMLGLHFVSTNKLSKEHARFYAQIFNERLSGDYDDFVFFDQPTIDALIPKAKDFIEAIEKLLKET